MKLDTKFYETINQKLDKLTKQLNGGPGSGNFGHAGRPGEVGGSAGQGGSTALAGAKPGKDIYERIGDSNKRSARQELVDKTPIKPSLKEGDTFELDGDTFTVDGKGGATNKAGNRMITEPAAYLAATDSFLSDSIVKMNENLKHTTFSSEAGKTLAQKTKILMSELRLGIQEAQRGIQPDRKAYDKAIREYKEAYKQADGGLGHYSDGKYNYEIAGVEPDRFERIYERTELGKALK